jgi:hypothetical protein
MTVKELILELSKLDPELEVLCYSEDGELLPPGHLFRLLYIESVTVNDAERRRNSDDGIPSLKFMKTEHSEKLAFLNVTVDF